MDKIDKPRRDFLFLATGAVVALGGVALTKPLFGHMSPAADKIADAGVEVDLSKLEEGMQMHFSFKGRPIAIRHRTPSEILAAKADDEADLIDPETDKFRLRPKSDGAIDTRFLIFHPICTHFGCIVVGESGDFGGWYCPCHGAHFDTSGRVRKGPAPRNMAVPNYKWVSDRVIKVSYLEN